MSRSAPARTLAIMAKAPVAGLVKTRLARDIGTCEALRCYRAMLGGLLRRVGRDPRWRTVLAVAPANMLNAPSWPRDIARHAQQGRDLGARMQHVMDTAAPGPVVIIGCDIPGIAPAHIAAAFKALGRHDLVFGPAHDGGYWLVGAKHFARRTSLFESVRWSSSHTLPDTLANAAGLKVAMLDMLEDVDDAASYRRWRIKS